MPQRAAFALLTAHHYQHVFSSLKPRSKGGLTKTYSVSIILYYGKNQSVYWTAAVYWPRAKRVTPSVAGPIGPYSKLQQYTGRAKRVTPSVTRPIAAGCKNEKRVCLFSLLSPSLPVLKTAVARGGCDRLCTHKKSRKKKEKNTCNVFVQVQQ